MRNRLKKIMICSTLISIATLGFLYSTLEKKQIAEASASKIETIDLRIIGTTDIHGQLSSMDYEKGVDLKNRGLARAYDLILKARAELPKENSLTFDAGDFLFDYTTEYIFSENQNEIQPIVQGMAMVGYDAITLGNHEFDYGYEYILRQLNGSGLRNITVMSNVRDSKTGEFPFLENMIITRNMKTNSGKLVQVKVGVIGQTIPTLTSKTHSYGGILVTEDIVDSTRSQATKLKEMGADIIVVIAHTGMGPENPEPNFKNVAYALTKIPEVDVILCGHEHNTYPTNDTTSPYLKMPGVDRQSYLINGKNVIMPGDRGKAVGVVDLTLNVINNQVEISNRKSELRFVTESSTKENKNIASLFGKWEEKLLQYSNDVIGVIEPGVVIQNYYGLLGDNTAIQLLNDSKIHYALKFANTTGKQYRDYPIIAASTYASYGVSSIDDFVNIHDQITESHLSTLQPYNNYLHVYTITGKQLKEWLEWSASAYETLSSNETWSNDAMAQLMKDKNLRSLIREEWLNDWSSFFIFDGIDYEINPFTQPRYDISGNRISNTSRVTKVTYNGKPVTDDMELLLSTNKITKPTDANRGVESQAVLKGFVRSQTILSKYIIEVSKSGTILPQVDNNWKVNLGDNNKFLVKAPYYAHDLIKNTRWYVDYLVENNQYRYYVASYPKNSEDVLSPHIIVAPTKTGVTRSPYEIAVNVFDTSEVKNIKFLKGDYDADYNGWVVARNIKNAFSVSENGIYSVYAEDIHGNKTVKKVSINNFNANLLDTPTVVNYTNRKTKITGTAEPGKTIVFDAYTGTYETVVPDSGNYSYALPSQPSGTEIIVYVKDKKTGMESEHISVIVKRTGPNQPTINPMYNNAGYLSGNINDDDASIVAIIENKVYVSDQGGKERYEKAVDIYERGLQIIETNIEVYDTGHFTMVLPVQEAGTKVTLYNLDHVSRVSRVSTVVVEEVAPNAPVIYEISNIEKTITGYVPSKNNTIYDVVFSIAGNAYTIQTDKKGKFSLTITDQLIAGQIIDVFAMDKVNDATRVSYVTRCIVEDVKSLVADNNDTLTLDPIDVSTLAIAGSHFEKGSVYLAITNGEGENFTSTLYTLEADNYTSKFYLYLDNPLEAGTKVYAMTRFTDGNILWVAERVVLPGKPEAPKLIKSITNVDKTVQVVSDKDCEVSLTIGEKIYRSKNGLYDNTLNRYVYTFTVDRVLSGTNVTITSTNISGTSGVTRSKVEKTAPDAPKMNAIKASQTEVTGTIELLDFVDPNSKAIGDESIPSRFKDSQPNVAKTQTRIFAEVGKKTYEGTIDNDGKFVINIPAQKAGAAIKVWGTNKAGRGPLVKITVVK